ncbi:MAG: T9SS type A sorting domain-containing protein [Bacteroidetes bacterium]|nr:T9SS type A sorting domain-containing protein [Bacteroidota bacterium]
MKKTNYISSLLLPFILFWVALFAGSNASAQQDQPADASIKVRPTRTETVSEIMERARLAPAPVMHDRPEKEYPDRSNLPQNPLSPQAATYPDIDRALVTPQHPPTDLPQTIGTSFNGFTSSSSNGPFPPDDMGSIGPTQYIVAVNGIIRSFNATTGAADGALNVTPDNFFAPVMTPPVSNNFTSDPRIRYDRFSGRWIIIIIDVPGRAGALPNKVLLAVSNASTITAGTTWTFSSFLGEAGVFFDYPTIGIDVNAVYIGGNMFSLAGGFLHTNGYVINRNILMSGGIYTVSQFFNLTSTGSGPYTPQGVDNFDITATQGYFIGVDNATYGTLMLRRVSSPAGIPTISANIPVTVSSTSFPASVPHLGNTGGTSGNLDAIDDRLFAAMIRGGHLWTAHTIHVNASGTTTSPNRNGVRWYDLTNLATTPSLNQSGTIFDPAAVNPRYYFFPSVMATGQGHAAFGMTSAGTSYAANAATTGRLASDGAGTTQSIALTTASGTAYNPIGDPGGPRRWGDYSYVSLDPLDDMTMWMVNQYCAGTDVYGCNVTKLIAPPPATPASCLPTSALAGQASVNVVVTGTVVSGSGFYDPGANIAAPALAFHHISAVVSGGVVVNSVTYTDPTHITVNINTTGAAAGLQTITVTNPDGQSRAGVAILKICPVIAVQNPAGASGTAGAVFSKTFTSTGGAVSVTYSTSSVLPAGLTLSSGGVLSGVPSVTGTFPIIVTATDANGCSGAGSTYTLLIGCPVESPSIAAGGPTTFCPGGSVQLTPTGGNALQFAGSGNYVTIPATINSSFGTNRITVEGWFYQTAATVGIPALVGEAFLTDGTIKFSIYLNGQQISAGFYAGAWTSAASTVNLPLNTWTHIAATYDQTAIRIYVNGVAAGSLPASSVLPTSTEEWRIARRWDLPDYFTGRMDEIRIWNVARTQAQIQSGMGAVVPPSTSGLVACYRFDEGSGVNAADLTGHGFNGTFAGTPTWVVPSTAPLAGYSGYLWSNGATTPGLTVNASGNYSVTVTDLYGCTGTGTPVAVTVKSLTGAAGAISGAAVSAQGHTGVAYSVAPVANATGYVWILPAGASIASGTNTNSITVDYSAVAVSGNITVYGTNDCGNGNISPPLAVTLIASTYNPGNTVVASGSVQCYNALQTIFVAGGGTTFTIQSGGSATMVAGQNIVYQTGTTAASGGYMHGYITTNNQYCGGMAPAMVTVVAGTETVPVVPVSRNMRVYPNPTTGLLTIELGGDQGPRPATVELFNTGGVRLISKMMNGDVRYTLSIADMPPGLYFLHVVTLNSAETIKLIKL